MWKVLLQVSSEDLSVLLMNLLHGSDALPPAVRTVVGSGTVIYTENFGAELVRAARTPRFRFHGRFHASKDVGR